MGYSTVGQTGGVSVWLGNGDIVLTHTPTSSPKRGPRSRAWQKGLVHFDFGLSMFSLYSHFLPPSPTPQPWRPPIYIPCRAHHGLKWPTGTGSIWHIANEARPQTSLGGGGRQPAQLGRRALHPWLCVLGDLPIMSRARPHLLIPGNVSPQ